MHHVGKQNVNSKVDKREVEDKIGFSKMDTGLLEKIANEMHRDTLKTQLLHVSAKTPRHQDRSSNLLGDKR